MIFLDGHAKGFPNFYFDFALKFSFLIEVAPIKVEVIADVFAFHEVKE